MNSIEYIVNHIDKEIARYKVMKEGEENRSHVILYEGAIMALESLKHDVIYQ